MPKVMVPLATGVEEMEAVIVIDTLRRAGIDVTSVGLSASPIVASRKVRLVPDAAWGDIRPAAFDGIVLPGGGEGAKNLARHRDLLAALREFDQAGKLIAAICAAPTVLQAAGVLKGRRATSYPGFASDMKDATYREERVVVDGHCITSRGPGTAFEFALAIITHLKGAAAAREVAEPMLLAGAPAA